MFSYRENATSENYYFNFNPINIPLMQSDVDVEDGYYCTDDICEYVGSRNCLWCRYTYCLL